MSTRHTPPIFIPAPPLRWVRARQERGVFCTEASHHGREYVFLEPRSAGKAAVREPAVEKLACDACWPMARNRTALPEREVSR